MEKTVKLPFELVKVSKDNLNIYDYCDGGVLYEKNGITPIFILVPRQDAIAVNSNSSKDIQVLRQVLSKYPVMTQRGSKRQGVSTHYATFGCHSNRFKSGLSNKIALDSNSKK